MKKILLSVIMLLILPSLFAIGLEIEKTSSNEVMILGINQPAIFDLQIKNINQSGSFQFYNLLGFDMQPKDIGFIKNQETKEIQLKV